MDNPVLFPRAHRSWHLAHGSVNLKCMKRENDGSHRQALGRRGEEIACKMLVAEGFRLLGRNWRDGKRGELDIIAHDLREDAVVFVEVKTRTTDACGRPAEAVTPSKLRRMRTLGRSWLSMYGCRYSLVRFDIVEVLVAPAGPARVNHIQGVDL